MTAGGEPVMASESPALQLLNGGGWGEYAEMIEQFRWSPAFPLLEEALRSLRREVLYMSHVHGVGHIERTMIHGAMCAAAEELSEADARLLLLMCSYHDTGRNCDFLDGAHGARSAEKLEGLTGLSGEELREAMAGIEAHSVGDGAMAGILERYAPENPGRARMLAEMLKDADGLDRVRIADLNPDYLRRAPSRGRAGFAQLLFDRYAALEKERPPESEPEGFDLPTIRRVNAFAAARFAEGKTCGQAALLALGELCRCPVSEELLASCPGEGGTCSLMEAACLFFGAFFAARGWSEEAVGALREEYRRSFRSQYAADACAALRPKAGCSGFAVDGILFAYRFLLMKMK